VILVTFFGSQGIIHKEFVPPGQTVNKEYYVEALLSFGSKTSSSKTSVSGKRKLVLLA
jgi:hypothetical protein